MIVFHRVLFVLACFISFMAGAINAGARDIAEEKHVNLLISMPLSTLVTIDMRDI